MVDLSSSLRIIHYLNCIPKLIRLMRSTVFLFVCIFVCLSCSEEEDPISGCTDSMSINYNELATIDDNTCAYSKLIIYSSEDKNMELGQGLLEDLVSVTVRIDGELIGSFTEANTFLSNCDLVSNTVGYTFTNAEPITFSYHLRTEDSLGSGSTSRGGSITITPNSNTECFVIDILNDITG